MKLLPISNPTLARFFHRSVTAAFALSLAGTLHAAPGWTMERFNDITGGLVSSLLESNSFYAPTSTTTITSSVLPSNNGDNYGRRISGYVIPPVTGLYTFWESGDAAVAIRLSPDASPENKLLIASHSGFTSPQEWTKFPTQQSRQIPLVAGKKYFIEILHKENTGADHLAIAWTVPGASRSLIPLSAMETYEPDVTSNSAGLRREVFTSIPGAKIVDLTESPAFAALPTRTTTQLTGLAPSHIDDSYGVRLMGHITPSITGDYVFWESGDDEVELYLSPTDSPNEKRLIASHQGFTSPQQWEKFPSQQSIPLRLVAGRRYYIEALHKEGLQGDHLAIAWTPPNGTRAILTNGVLRAWGSPVDNDGDSIPDAYELAVGLNPTDRADAVADSDGDTISNLQEYRRFANPGVLDPVAGHIEDEIWFAIPGDKLTRSSYKAAATREIDLRGFVTTTRAYDKGEEYVRRVRGSITAPVTGAYQFWATADDDVDFFLSTTASKFQMQHIISSTALDVGINFDLDVSQKSQLISLTAGQKYYFEIWHKEGRNGSNVAVAWKTPNGSREIIPSFFLTSYGIDPDDQDDDGISDAWELLNGLSITDDGKSPGSKDGSYGDLDGDGLTNLEEFKSKTKANLIDSDGDGVGDYDEVHFFDSATLANDIGAFIPVATLTGDSYTNSFGEWEKFAGKAHQNGRRGSVTYPITVPNSGIYALKFTITSILDGAKNEQHDFHVKLNGHHLAYKSIIILPDGTATLPVLSPWLQAGVTYNIEIFVDNSYNSRRVSIDQLEILAASGTDSNNNNTPDWTEIRVNDTNGLDTPGIIHSRTSPAVIEGKAKYLGLLTTNAPSPIAAPNGRFFTEVPFTPANSGQAVNLAFAFENNCVTQSTDVYWQPTNLKVDNAMTIRQGDSLLLTAFVDAESASLEIYTYTLNGNTITNKANQPTAQLFSTAGNQVIQVTHTAADGTITSRSLTITVLPKITLVAPACVVGHPRIWIPPALPSGSSLVFDSQMQSETGATAGNYTITTNSPRNLPVLVKSASGLILGCSHIKGCSVRAGALTGNLLSNVTATHAMVDIYFVAYGDIGATTITCDLFQGGVTFLDGSLSSSLTSLDFDVYGLSKLRTRKLYNAHAVCHRVSVWENGFRIANFN